MMGLSTVIGSGAVIPGQDQVWGSSTHPGILLWDVLPHGWG